MNPQLRHIQSRNESTTLEDMVAAFGIVESVESNPWLGFSIQGS